MVIVKNFIFAAIGIIYVLVCFKYSDKIDDMLYKLHKRHRNKFRKFIAIILELFIIPYIILDILGCVLRSVIKALKRGVHK